MKDKMDHCNICKKTKSESIFNLIKSINTLCSCKYHLTCLKNPSNSDFYCNLCNQYPSKKNYICNLVLKDFQKDIMKFILQEENKSGLLALDMGLGKTIIMLHTLVHYNYDMNLIIVPKILIEQWRDQILKHTNYESNDIVLYIGTKRKSLDFTNKKIILTTYNLLSDIYGDTPLSMNNFNTIICDEAHILKNNKTQTYNNLLNIIHNNNIQWTWLLTGTPLVNDVKDIYNLSNILNIEFNTFKKNHFIKLMKTDIQKKDPFCIDIKQKFIFNHFVQLDDNHYKYYEYMSKFAKENGYIKLVTILKLRQIAITSILEFQNSDFVLSLTNIENKFKTILNIIYNIPKDQKIVVFSQWDTTIMLFKEILELTDIKYQLKTIDDFDTNDNRVLICNIKSAGFGLNLQCANHMIFIDQPWNNAVLQQAIDRCYRIGQNKNVFIHNVISHNTIENWLNLVIKQKIIMDINFNLNINIDYNPKPENITSTSFKSSILNKYISKIDNSHYRINHHTHKNPINDDNDENVTFFNCNFCHKPCHDNVFHHNCSDNKLIQYHNDCITEDKICKTCNKNILHNKIVTFEEDEKEEIIENLKIIQNLDYEIVSNI
jgi:SNF2 family DNA or RNA helicase